MIHFLDSVRREKGGSMAAYKSGKTMKGGKRARARKREGFKGECIERERQLAAFSRDDSPNRWLGSLRRRGRTRLVYLCPSLLFHVSWWRSARSLSVYEQATTTRKTGQQSGRVRA